MSDVIIDVQGVSKSFGGVKANTEVSMQVERGGITGLIGPNGSGKTTLFNSIVGYHPIDAGSIKFEGQEISKLSVQKIARLGLLRTFQQTRIYGAMNGVENMLISLPHRKMSLWDALKTNTKEDYERADQLLDFVGLYEKRLLKSGDLSFGQQKLLEFAMALMNEPTCLLLDDRPAQARQRGIRHHPVCDRAQHARDHEPGRIDLLPRPRANAGAGHAGRNSEQSGSRRRLPRGALA